MKEMSKKSENSDNGVLNGSSDSPSVDNDSNNNGVLRKGPWTSEEDDILMDYVRKHGEGNWNAVQKHSGLARCGKSCRLRWTNHLRPDLKKGAFSPEEERLVVELHAKMGNKWSRMAPELPGRTDNEIKNFWNTRIKRRKKTGLPIYPPDICPQVQNDNQQGDEVDSCFLENVYHPPGTSIEIPPVEFKNLDQNRYASILGDIPTINLPEIPAGSYSTNALAKELCGSEMFFTYGNQSSTDGFLRCAPSLGFSSPYDHCSGFLTSTPSSQPSCAMKLELSSFQNQMGSWGSPWLSSSSFPVFEDASIQTENMCTLPSLNNNGLLDAAPYASKTVTKSKNCSFPWDSLASKMAATYSSQGLYAGFEYDEHFSPLGHSSSSVFCDSPLVSCNTFDELQSIDELIPVKEETGNADRVLGNEKINSECVDPVKQLMNGYSLETLDKSKKMDAGAASQAQFHSQGLCAWNASASSLLWHINSTEARIRTEIEQFFAVPAAWDDNEL